MQKEKLKFYSYAKRDARMDLDNEAELKEFKEEYREFLNTLWDNIKNKQNEYQQDPGRGPYSDPDSFDLEKKVRNNDWFYEDLCKFLNCQFGYDIYFFKDNFIKYGGEDKYYGEKFYPDQFGFSAPCTNLNHIYDRYLILSQKYGKNKDEAIEKVINWVIGSRTIGGAFIWPKTMNRRISYNCCRGKFYIEDRVDLTLLEIKHYLEGTSKKEDILPNRIDEIKWLDYFKKLDPSNPFKKYVDTFCFNSFVDKNYMPYDILKSDFADKKKIVIKEDKTLYNKENSIYKIEELEIVERMLNNVNILIEKRSKQILKEINKKNNYTLCDQLYCITFLF